MGSEGDRGNSRDGGAPVLASILLRTLPDYRRGLRGQDLQRALFDHAGKEPAESIIEEVEGLVKRALRQLGIEELPGIRLGFRYDDYVRLRDNACREELAKDILLPRSSKSTDAAPPACWLDGPLFTAARVEAHVRACEESASRAVGQVALNVKRALQDLRQKGDPVCTALHSDLREAADAGVERGEFEWICPGRRHLRLRPAIEKDLSAEEAAEVFSEEECLVEMQRLAARYCDPGRPKGRGTLRSVENRARLSRGLAALVQAGCARIDISGLANQLRERLPSPPVPTLRESTLDNEEGWHSFFQNIEGRKPAPDGEIDTNHLRESLEQAVEALPSCSDKRRQRLQMIAGAWVDALDDRLGDEGINHVEIQQALGIKKQTYSDDRKILDPLVLGALAPSPGPVGPL